MRCAAEQIEGQMTTYRSLERLLDPLADLALSPFAFEAINSARAERDRACQGADNDLTAVLARLVAAPQLVAGHGVEQSERVDAPARRRVGLPSVGEDDALGERALDGRGSTERGEHECTAEGDESWGDHVS